MSCLRIIITGLVQGVGFRAWVVEKAQSLHITGWVKNQPDGKVEIEAYGTKENLDQFIQKCRIGPVGARVEDLLISRIKSQGDFDGFTVIY